MKPIGPLMREHRLIERMIGLMKAEIHKVGEGKEVEPDFIKVAVDFFRTYADRTHHGKEEDILFRDLARRQISPEHKKIMDELVEEHVLARKTVGSLLDAAESYGRGGADSLDIILACSGELVAFYPGHIEKEDKHFFYPAMEYFNKEEQDSMLHEFWEFDRSMIHEKYQKVVGGLENR